VIEGSLRLFGYGLGLFLFGEGRERRTPEGEDIGSGKDFVVGIQLGFREGGEKEVRQRERISARARTPSGDTTKIP